MSYDIERLFNLVHKMDAKLDSRLEEMEARIDKRLQAQSTAPAAATPPAPTPKPPPPKIPPGYINLNQAAERNGRLTAKQLGDMVRKGWLKTYDLGRRRKYTTPADVDALDATAAKRENGLFWMIGKERGPRRKTNGSA